jgi:hypothetical protein
VNRVNKIERTVCLCGQYLSIAEHNPVSTSKRSQRQAFATLSVTLGDICLQLHQGLCHVIGSSSNHNLPLTALVPVLKAMAAFLASAPYSRLPEYLLPSALNVLQVLSFD